MKALYAARKMSEAFIEYASRAKTSFEHQATATLRTLSDRHPYNESELASMRSAFTVRYERLVEDWVKHSVDTALSLAREKQGITTLPPAPTQELSQVYIRRPFAPVP